MRPILGRFIETKVTVYDKFVTSSCLTWETITVNLSFEIIKEIWKLVWKKKFPQILGEYKPKQIFQPLIAGKGCYICRVNQSLHNSNPSSYQASQREDLLNFNVFLKCTHLCALKWIRLNGSCLLEIKYENSVISTQLNILSWLTLYVIKLRVGARSLPQAHWDMYDSWYERINMTNYITQSIYINNKLSQLFYYYNSFMQCCSSTKIFI